MRLKIASTNTAIPIAAGSPISVIAPATTTTKSITNLATFTPV